MIDKKIKPCFLSGNALKIIAAVAMLVDHMGYLLFEDYIIFRIIGRISFPIFAFMISEGCNYTKNKLRYFLGIFSLSALCQVAYYIFNNSLDMGILVTFSLSILVIYSLQNFKEKLFLHNSSLIKIFCAALCFLLMVAIVYILNIYFNIDYGFWGCMTPVFASVFSRTKESSSKIFEKLDSLAVCVFMICVSLLILSIDLGGIQVYSLLSLPFLMLYSGERGKLKMKSFFYVFYPAHLVVLQIIHMLLQK